MKADRWHRLTAIFASVRARGPATRAAVLDEQCAKDGDLRADVEELLRHEFPSTPAMDVIAGQLAQAGSKSAVGATLSTYTLQALIGEGGMGQVYRAHDAALGRAVAVKILPPVYAIDPDRRARFEREARLLASLNHPHIGAIYGLAEGDGLYGLVLELVEGETLDERLEKARRIRASGLAVREALSIARQVAEGLEAAHERGIVHRDLKPSNIKIAPDGVVKVLDFGVAKAVSNDDVRDVPSASVDAPLEPLASGIVGTAAYMSPEQALGAAVDRRSDIWAFGCVLYEMLAGKHAFYDGSAARPATSDSEPDWKLLPIGIPTEIQSLLRRCLERDQRRRLRDIGEARVLLEDLLAAPVSTGTATTPRWRARLTLWSVLAIGSLATVAIVAGRFAPSDSEVVPLPIRRVEVPLQPSQVPAPLLGVAISADGAQLAYVADEAGQNRLCVRALGSSDTRCLEGTEGASFPFFSPNGEWIAYFAGGEIRRIQAGGGPSVAIAIPRDDGGLKMEGTGRGTWTANEIIFSDGNGLWKVPVSGDGPALRISTLDRGRGEIAYRSPTMLTDGRTLLYVVWSGPGWGEREVVARRLDTGETRVVLHGAGVVRYARSGHLVYSRAGVLMAVRFDPSRLEVSGAPVAVQEGVREGTMNADWDLSPDGSLAFVRQSRDQFMRQMEWVDRSGAVTPLPGLTPAYYQNPVIAQDGQRAAFMITGELSDIWVYEFARAALTRVTTEGSSQYPVWSADGTRIAYRATRAGSRNLYWRPVDGTSGEERLTTSPHEQMPWSMSRDGRMLAFAEDGESGTQIGLLSLWNGGARMLIREGASSTKSKISPDGRLIAYVSDRSGRNEVYVQTLSVTDRRWQVSLDGGTDPVWAPDGRELYYRWGAAVMAARMGTDDPLRMSAPSKLFEGPTFRSEPTIDYDIHPDGQRFLIVRPLRPDPPLTHLNLVLNFHEELNVRLPASR
jgi:eukaryotic-like serine/threonine-protein kinase